MWWVSKLERNRARDERNDAELRDAGWAVLRLWEHEPVERAVELVHAALAARSGLVVA